jgi:ABC-type phosphate transport system substrate-binding protein
MNRNYTIAAAVAAALCGGAAFAAPPSIATINSTPVANTINIMGSSAIKTALTNSILANFCGGAGNAVQVTSNGTSSNFVGIACTPVGTLGTNFSNGGNYNIWIRYEGGSVSGYLPIVNEFAAGGTGPGGIGFPVSEIDGPSLTSSTITINGASTGNGTNDSFSVAAGGALSKHFPDLAIGDVEPKALIGSNYPQDYSTSVWGPNNQAGMFGLPATGGIVDEVYALFVNESSTGANFTENPLNLSRQMIASILTAQVTDWSQVVDVAGNAVTSGPLPIKIVNREFGSGSRAATDILLVGDGCGSAGAPATLSTSAKGTRYFATGDVLKAANSIAGAITYATIDNTPPGASGTANLSFVSIGGVAPSNLAAAAGTYPFWVEAQYVNNTTNTHADGLAVNTIIASLQNQATTAALFDVDAIPNVSSALGTGPLNTGGGTIHLNPTSSGVVPSGGGTVTVYLNPYTRSGTTCANPIDNATVIP